MDAKENAMRYKPKPELADDDAPELSSGWFEEAKPASNALPRLVGMKNAAELLEPKRGRPPVENPKEHVNIRLDSDIVQAFKNKGLGWQTRVNGALREWQPAVGALLEQGASKGLGCTQRSASQSPA
jgi:uncharacterized protein (DUF4415 family)